MRYILLFCSMALFGELTELLQDTDQNIVLRTRRYHFDEFPTAFNPSLIEVGGKYLMTFRYAPHSEDWWDQYWLSDIGVVFLDENLDPISDPYLLNTRPDFSKTPSQSEDGRVFPLRGRYYLIYNDNIDTIAGWGKRRDMFLSKIIFSESGIELSAPLKLIHEHYYQTALQQKNWVPFEWNQQLFFSYSINPHEVITPCLKTGVCHTIYNTEAPIDWPYGTIRGGTPPVLVDGEYLAFFHSGIRDMSSVSNGEKLWHYFMGAYTFSAEPPFQLTGISAKPILCDQFYTASNRLKRVIFPGGFVVNGNEVILAYGKDDAELWIGILDLSQLKKSLIRFD